MLKKEEWHWNGRWKVAPFIFGILMLIAPVTLTPTLLLIMTTIDYTSLNFLDVIAILVLLVMLLAMLKIAFAVFPLLQASRHSISLHGNSLTLKTPGGSRTIEIRNVESVILGRVYTKGFFNLHWIEIKERGKVKPIRILHEFFDDPQLEILSELRSVVDRNEFGQLATMKK